MVSHRGAAESADIHRLQLEVPSVSPLWQTSNYSQSEALFETGNISNVRDFVFVLSNQVFVFSKMV